MEQTEYLQILLDAAGFETRLKRNAYLSRECGREIKYLEDMTQVERHRLIEELKERRNRDRPEREDDRG
jgi:hypothetical protein